MKARFEPNNVLLIHPADAMEHMALHRWIDQFIRNNATVVISLRDPDACETRFVVSKGDSWTEKEVHK